MLQYQYAKIIGIGLAAEIYRYGNRPRGGRPRAVPDSDAVPRLFESREDVSRQEKPTKVRTEANARSARVAFRRLVQTNLDGFDHPVLATFTYAENFTDISASREDFNAFAKRARGRFGEQFKYIVVIEFQKRGSIHFHALLWGIPARIIKSERRTRVVGRLWRHGFVDLIPTDGHAKLATYLSKYMAKSFVDARFASKKAYISSYNVKRPIIIKDAVLSPHFYGIAEPDLSTAHLAQEHEYDTNWLGRCHYQKYIIPKV